MNKKMACKGQIAGKPLPVPFPGSLSVCRIKKLITLSAQEDYRQDQPIPLISHKVSVSETGNLYQNFPKLINYFPFYRLGQDITFGS